MPGKKYDLARRVNELNMMLRGDFLDSVDAAGFQIAAPSVLGVRKRELVAA